MLQRRLPVEDLLAQHLGQVRILADNGRCIASRRAAAPADAAPRPRRRQKFARQAKVAASLALPPTLLVRRGTLGTVPLGRGGCSCDPSGRAGPCAGLPPPGPEPSSLSSSSRSSSPSSFTRLGLGSAGMYSKASLRSLPSPSTRTRTVPPACSNLPNSNSSASGFFDVLLDHPRQWAGAELLVVARVGQPTRGVFGELDGDAAVGQLRLELEHELLSPPS